MNLGEKIKELRLKNNMTQDDLALKCYVTRNAVSKWENDKGYPNIESIKLLCKCFNITIDELLNDEINEHAVKELTVEVPAPATCSALKSYATKCRRCCISTTV